MKTRKTLAAVRGYAILTVLAALMFAPIYYLIIGSFKPSAEVLNGFGGFLPVDLSFNNYAKVFASLSSDSTGYFLQYVLNSLTISGVIVIVGLVINSMAGYAFARLEWMGRDKVFLIVVILVIVPFESAAIPLLFMLQGERDTLLVQIIPFLANAFSVYLFYTSFLSSNASVEEAARIDGLGAFGTFVRVVAPNSKPVFATVAILTFLSSWGQFLWPSLTTSDPAVRPLPLEMGAFSGLQPVDWGAVFAFGTMLVLPILILFLAFQRFFVQSVASSAVKE
ncbi:carbohydrate ABC transporter permease [Galbitalea soli]|uniref:Carbohydrate ABC transporter permease n=1 Tax=Galbitalea soli TaxID=1268042 RepID=A0A7C9PPI5_9MICO|nr:carbohydrate ABC transporter permease [Galbitalea soli]NEM92307.1 carbohydrate ABC transporter permease [Galbitalea soli]NYJ31737.1 multiple sugar transport system permease protein [Galbitalea soli]